MVGKLRLAAKLFLGTTLLAGGGSGAYLYKTGNWPLPTAPAKPESAQASESDLDAVASAWAEPAAATAKSAPDSSATARSADGASAPATDKVLPPAGDRYASTPDSTVEQEVATGASVAIEPLATSAEKAEPVVEAFAKEPEEAAPTPAEPTPVLAVEESAVVDVDQTTDAKSTDTIARGQAPPEEPGVTQAQATQDDANAAFLAIAGDDQPQGLNPGSQQPAAGNTSGNRARQAFNAQTRPPTGERYGSAAATAPAVGAGGTVENPFATKSAPAAAAARNTIEPLPSGTSDIGGPLSEMQQNNEGLQPLAPNRSARAASNSRARSYPTPQQGAPQTGDSPNAGFDSLPAPSSLPTSANSSAATLGGDGSGEPGEKALEGPQQPSLVIQKFAPGEIQVGKPAKFVVQVRNVGSQAADDVTIRDEVPKGTQLVSTSPEAQANGSELAWQLGKLSPGEDRTVEMQVMPKAEGELGSVATVSYSAQASVKTKCTMPQLAIRMTAPSEVMVGQEQHVKIEIRNPGSGDATGVMLFENVPKNVRHAAGPALEFEIGTLRAGETRELDLLLVAEKAGKVVNALTARADGNLQVQQQVEFEVIAPALSIDVTGPERRYLERPATYEVSVENPGTAAAHDVQIVTKLPKGLRFVRANNMGEYDASTHAVYWSLSELPKGERGTVELVAMPIETGPQTLEVESRAQQGLTDQKKREIVIEGLAAIMFEVKDLEDPIEVGGETGYEIRIVNQGTKAADNVQVAVELPPGMKVVSAEGETQHKVQQGRLIFEPLQQLAAKADTVYRVKVQGMQAGDQRVNVEVNTDDLSQPIRREESTRVFGDE
jgi:uncharacterized repeat protein (TIGR01451 family)